MKAYKVLALLKKVPLLKAGDRRVKVNGEPFTVDYRVVADDLFSDGLQSLEEALSELEAVKAELEKVKLDLHIEKEAHKVDADLLKQAEAERDELREALDDKTKRFNTACNQWDQLKKVLDQTEEELKGFKLAEEHQRKNAVAALLDLGKCQEEVQRLTALLTSLGHEQD